VKAYVHGPQARACAACTQPRATLRCASPAHSTLPSPLLHAPDLPSSHPPSPPPLKGPGRAAAAGQRAGNGLARSIPPAGAAAAARAGRGLQQVPRAGDGARKGAFWGALRRPQLECCSSSCAAAGRPAAQLGRALPSLALPPCPSLPPCLHRCPFVPPPTAHPGSQSSSRTACCCGWSRCATRPRRTRRCCSCSRCCCRPWRRRLVGARLGRCGGSEAGARRELRARYLLQVLWCEQICCQTIGLASSGFVLLPSLWCAAQLDGAAALPPRAHAPRCVGR
jgi:hypothetical protein